MIISSIEPIENNTIFICDDGEEIIVRPNIDGLNAACKERNINLIGIEIGLLDYEYMRKNWKLVQGIYRDIDKSQLIENFNPPIDYNDFNNRIFDVYGGIKPYMIYLTKEYAITERHSRMWVYRNGKRLYLNYSGTIPTIEGELSDIVNSV